MDSRYILMKRGLGDAVSDALSQSRSTGMDPAAAFFLANGRQPNSQEMAALGYAPSSSDSGGVTSQQVVDLSKAVVQSTGQVLSSVLPSILGPSTTTGGLAIRPATYAQPQSSPWGTVALVGGAGLILFLLLRGRK